MADKLKWLAALLVTGGAIFAFYLLDQQIMVIRVLLILVALGVAVALLRTTEVGGQAWAFGRGALVEVRKVVWPSRKETTQTTMLVMAMVLVVGILLWLFDMFLVWAVKLLTGQGG